MVIGISAILSKAIEHSHSIALGALLLLGYGCAESEQSASKIYAIPKEALVMHGELQRLSSNTIMTISGDGKAAGGAYCDPGSDAACSQSKLRELALQNCRANGGHNCVVFAVGDQIIVKYVVIGLCTLQDGSRTVTSEAGCHDSNGTFTSLPVAAPPIPTQPETIETAEKNPADLALENTLIDWVKDHQPEFRRMLDSHLRQRGIMPSDSTGELGVNSVGTIAASHHRDQEYEITVHYVLTRGGLPETMQTYQHPQVHYDQQQSFTVRFDGTRIQFL
jgi:hypothetical protein